MRKIVFLLIASFALVFTACNKEKIDKVNPADLEVNLNKAELQQRIEMLNFPITFNNFKASADDTPIPELWAVAKILPSTREMKVYHWTNDGNVTRITTGTNVDPDGLGPYVAATPANSTSGIQTLSVTGAGIGSEGVLDYAYFTSHVRGEVFGGEIFVVTYSTLDAVDDDAAVLAVASVFDPTADYNDLTVDDNTTLWVAGDNNARGAILRKVPTTDLHGLADATVEDADVGLTKFNMPLLGPSGNSITIFEDQLWVVAGGTSYGGLMVMDKTDDTRLYTRVDRTNAKHFDMSTVNHGSGYYGAFLYGDGIFNNDEANIRIFNTSQGPFAYFDDKIEADVTLAGKNGIDVDGDYVYLAMGEDGVFKYEIDVTGAAVNWPTQSGIVDSYAGPDTFGNDGGLANSLVVVGDYVYVAWGAKGLVILDKNTLDMVGHYNGIGSCNYVAFNANGAGDDILWVGFGTGGMLMLKFVDDVE